MLIDPIVEWVKDKIGGENARTEITLRDKTYVVSYAKPRTGYDAKYAMATVYVSTANNEVSLKLNIFVNLDDDVQLADYNNLDDVVSQAASKTLDEALFEMETIIAMGDFKVFADLLV
jgi:hypothetical protein